MTTRTEAIENALRDLRNAYPFTSRDSRAAWLAADAALALPPDPPATVTDRERALVRRAVALHHDPMAIVSDAVADASIASVDRTHPRPPERAEVSASVREWAVAFLRSSLLHGRYAGASERETEEALPDHAAAILARVGPPPILASGYSVPSEDDDRGWGDGCATGPAETLRDWAWRISTAAHADGWSVGQGRSSGRGRAAIIEGCGPPPQPITTAAEAYERAARVCVLRHEMHREAMLTASMSITAHTRLSGAATEALELSTQIAVLSSQPAPDEPAGDVVARIVAGLRDDADSLGATDMSDADRKCA